MKILWICGLPKQVQQEVLEGKDFGAHAAWSWILGHLPPPLEVELHIACPCVKIRKAMEFDYAGSRFHLVPCLLGRLQTGFVLDPLFFRPLVNRLKPDVVHGWGTEDSYSIVAQALARDRCVVQVQGLINGYRDFLPNNFGMKYIAFRERCSLKQARTVFVESGYSAEITTPYCGEGTEIVQVDHPLREEFLTVTPATGAEKGILFVGSLCERKGYLDAVRAFETAASADWTLRMVGAGGALESQNLDTLISSLPSHVHVEKVPQATPSEIVDLMQQSSIFLLPSSMDTGPTALKEALAMGLWPVCYDNSGPMEYIGRFGYGSVAKTGDLADLAEALSIAINSKPWQQSGRLDSAVAQVRQELCAETIWQQLLNHYQDIALPA